MRPWSFSNQRRNLKFQLCFCLSAFALNANQSKPYRFLQLCVVILNKNSARAVYSSQVLLAKRYITCAYFEIKKNLAATFGARWKQKALQSACLSRVLCGSKRARRWFQAAKLISGLPLQLTTCRKAARLSVIPFNFFFLLQCCDSG